MHFPLYLALKYLKPKRSVLSVVTVVSILGVLLGVAILVIVMAVMTGFDDMWRAKILSFKPHLTVVGRNGTIEDPDTVCKTIEAVDGVAGTAPVIETLALMQYGDLPAAPVVLGIDPDRAESVSSVGRSMKEGIFDLDGDKIVVGTDLAQYLNLMVGDKVLLYSPRNVMAKDELYLPEELTVSGIFDMGMRDFDSRFVLVPLEVARDLVGMDWGAHSVYVMTEDAFRFETYARRVREVLGPHYICRTWRDVDTLLFAALSNEKAMMFALLVFITVVAIFCVTNTLIVVTVNKTSEIGLLKALGFPAWKIMAVFVWHGWIQCLIGTLAGIGTGLLVLHHLPAIVAFLASFNVDVFPKEIYGLDKIPWKTSAHDLAFVGGFVMAFCTLSSLIPAVRAASLDPVGGVASRIGLEEEHGSTESNRCSEEVRTGAQPDRRAEGRRYGRV